MASGLDIRSGSPIISSGRASPANARLKQKDEHSVSKEDKSIRKYAALVERVLATFDQSVAEWADYISFLGRLTKALQARPPNAKDIPHSVLVAKRLSQCLVASLPSGVHQKALEVYRCIFSFLGREGLSRNLALYLPGIVPVISFASLSVKPIILALYEEYLVKLDPIAIRPALKSLILSLLPALEEENSEEFDRALHILAAIKTSIAHSERRDSLQMTSRKEHYFWQCLFLASITSPSRRAGALAYLVRQLPHLGSSQRLGDVDNQSSFGTANLADAIAAVATPDPGLLVRCFCAGLQDEHVLVQRGFLDLLVERLPLDSSVLQTKAAPGDLEMLVMSATAVVLRRDMSLNRRIWIWFLNSTYSQNDMVQKLDVKSPVSPVLDGTNEHALQAQYFKHNGLVPLIEGIRKQFNSTSLASGSKIRSLRFCIALMDRSEIGNLIVPHLLIPAIKSVMQYHHSSAPKSSRAEVLRCGGIFFDGIESHTIWAEIVRLLKSSFESWPASASNDGLDIICFVLNKYNICENEMQTTHLPLAALYGAIGLKRISRNVKFAKTAYAFLVQSCRLVLLLLQKTPAQTLSSRSLLDKQQQAVDIKDADLLAHIEAFYLENNNVKQNQVLTKDVGAIILQTCCDTLAHILAQEHLCPSPVIEAEVSILDAAFRKVPWHQPNVASLTTHLAELSRPRTAPLGGGHLTKVLTAVSVIEILHISQHKETLLSVDFLRDLIPNLVAGAWEGLSSVNPQHHVESARCIWRMHAICSKDDLVESAVVSIGADFLTREVHQDVLDHAQRFGTFWQQSQGNVEFGRNRRIQVARAHNALSANKLQLLERPLFQVLDGLLEHHGDLATYVEHWLEGLSDLPLVVSLVLERVVHATTPLTALMAASDQHDQDILGLYEPDIDMCAYLVEMLERIISCTKVSLAQVLSGGLQEGERDQLLSRLELLVHTCIKLQACSHPALGSDPLLSVRLKQGSLKLAEATLQLFPPDLLVRLKLDLSLLDELDTCIKSGDNIHQVLLIRTVTTTLNLRLAAHRALHEIELRSSEAQAVKGVSKSSNISDRHKSTEAAEQQFAVPAKVLYCTMSAISNQGSWSVLDSWFKFLQDCLPLYGPNIFQVLLPLNRCLCKTLREMLRELETSFGASTKQHSIVNDGAVIQVLNALERPLELAHGILAEMLIQESSQKPDQQASGLFGMVSVLGPEAGKLRSSTENIRLTVLLCFKDALMACFEAWSFDSSPEGILDENASLASFKYTTLRLRNRTRRIIEHLFQAQDLECTESLVALWQDCMLKGKIHVCEKVLALIGTIETARPRVIVPVLFNAIYSRTHPAALEPDRRSSLTSELSEATLTAFLTRYIQTLEDDATAEIWQSCITFLKDVLTSPLNHRQILPQLLHFAVELGSKVDNTNFGEQRKMRRELGDLFVRLLSAVTTIQPSGVINSHSVPRSGKLADSTDTNKWYQDLITAGSADLATVLNLVFPRLSKTLLEHDRLASVASQVSNQFFAPILKSKAFPENFGHSMLELLNAIGQIPEATKTFKKDVADAFYDNRFFSIECGLAKSGWLPAIRQWSIGDKDRLPDLFSRLMAPAAAGIMFGVGATSARLEADRKTQLTLRRVCTLLVSGHQDAFVVNLPELGEKLEELLNATSTSSPSSATRAEVYMVIRALLLKVTPNHLNALWPIITSEISETLSSVMPPNSHDSISPESLVQLCKLIDILLLLNFDDFQLQEWLYITDTTDAIYHPNNVEVVALSDLLAENLDAKARTTIVARLPTVTADESRRKPLLMNTNTKRIKKEEYLDRICRPFFRQLSIASFEGNYSMELPDLQACMDDLVADLFDDSTLV